VKELDGEVRHRSVAVEDVEKAGIGELTEHRGLYPHLVGKGEEFVDMGRGDRKAHPFLGL